MKSHRRIVSVAAVFLAGCLLSPAALRAQRMTQAGGMRTVSRAVRVRPVATRAIAAPRAGFRSAPSPAGNAIRSPYDQFDNDFAGGSASGVSLQQLLDPVPGLGFDYSYLAAIDSDLGVKAFIDPATELRLAAAERVLRDTRGFATPGYYLLDGGAEYVVPAETPPQQAPQPTVIVLQQPPAAQQTAAQPAPAAAPQSSPPLPDVSQFTLVLRSGGQIQVIALTRTNDRVVYITADGARHTIALADIDAAATRSVNEERGTPLQL
jgi:hypothetical protein